MLCLTACAIIEYMSQSVVLVLGPMVALHFYPDTSFPRLGFYTAILSGSGFLGHALSCSFWINSARSLQSSKGVILWGLAVTGAGFFSLLLCKNLVAMSLVRFATGLCSGVSPVALIEIDNICGSRQTKLALVAKALGGGLGAIGTFALLTLGTKLSKSSEEDPAERDSSLYFYPFCFVSIMAWIAVIVMLVALRLRSRATSYTQLAEEDDDFLSFTPQVQSETQTALRSSTSANASSTCSSECGSPVGPTVAHVKSVFEEAFGRTATSSGIKKAMASPTELAAITMLATPQPHFRLIRRIMPHYYHGYTSDGHLVVWDFVGRVNMDKLNAAGYTTSDLRDHYHFFLAFAQEMLLRTSTQKIVYVVDLDGLSLGDADARAVDCVCAVVKTLQRELPNRLQVLAVLNSPVWFSQVMKRIRPHLAKRTADKVSFLSKETATRDLIALIGVDSLPQRYGGRNGVEIGKSAQERSLDTLLKRTTAPLERTIEIVGTPRSQRPSVDRSHAGTTRCNVSDDGSDEEAFFDCSEYGLQGVEDVEDQEPEISVVIVSQSTPSPKTEATARSSSATSGSYQSLTKKPVKAARSSSNPVNASTPELTITREPLACLVLLVYFFWSLVQLSFDEMLPLWFFKQNLTALGGSVHAEPPSLRSTVSSITLTVSGTLASLSLAVLLGQTASAFVCSSARNVMTPLATLRFGLLLQVPILGCFPLIHRFKMEELPFCWVLVVVVLALKQLVAGVASHGIMALLDNSVVVDRRLAVHRASQRIRYVAHFIGSAGAPALFALLGYFDQAFPFDQSLLYFVQALGLVFLLCFSVAVPSRMNFPVLFSLGKR
uniref:CRAL-TRIO domain-containing protein n=1 Tax=Hyaloperonospora arabidopsidis (strain Emoy2) TaxID=559515 RepID=M4BNZ5_HYAAE